MTDLSLLPDPCQQLVSLVLPVPVIAANNFLAQARGLERFYWAEPIRDGRPGFVLAAAGVAAEISVAPMLGADETEDVDRFKLIDEQVHLLVDSATLLGLNGDSWQTIEPGTHPARPRLLGGFSFRPDFTPDNTWATFRPAHFVLPHYQYASDGLSAWLTLNAVVGPEEAIEALAPDLAEALLARAALLQSPPATEVGDRQGLRHDTAMELRYPMAAEQWAQMIQDATMTIHAGALQKVVLARVGEARLAHDIDAAAALAYLDETYADSYRFLFEAIPYHAFFGATPELLVSRQGREVQTMALAGSVARGREPAEDQALAEALLASAKDQHEHALVVHQIEARLRPLTDSLEVPPTPTILRLRNIQHLLTPVCGCLGGETPAGVLELVEELHPTPALGGLPVDRAMTFISDHEPVPRGWYAAPIGWLDQTGNGAFAVAIRSAVTQYNRAWLYAGAGIVGASDPDREWAETELKFKPMREVLEALGAEEQR